jgi:hypothetical protein
VIGLILAVIAGILAVIVLVQGSLGNLLAWAVLLLAIALIVPFVPRGK